MRRRPMLLRFLLVLAAALRQPRVAATEEIRTRHRCWPWDCDANFHMNDGRFVSVSGLARVALMMRLGLFPRFRHDGWRPIASAAEVRYFREIRPLARFQIRTRIVTWDEKYFVFEHLFELAGRDGPVAAARILVRSLFRRRSGPIPTAEVLASIGFAGPRPEPAEEIRHWMELSELMRRRRAS